MRRDALLAASRLTLAVREIAQRHPHYARGTVGRLVVAPNSRNVIPGRVEMSVDLRNADDATLGAMAAAVREAADAIAQADGVSIALTETVYFPPCIFDAGLAASIEAAAAGAGYSHRRSPAAPVTTPSTSRAPARPRWSSCRARAASATTRSRTRAPTTCTRARTCCCRRCSSRPLWRRRRKRRRRTGQGRGVQPAAIRSASAINDRSLPAGPSSEMPSGAPSLEASGSVTCGKPASPEMHSILIAALR